MISVLTVIGFFVAIAAVLRFSTWAEDRLAPGDAFDPPTAAPATASDVGDQAPPTIAVQTS